LQLPSAVSNPVAMDDTFFGLLDATQFYDTSRISLNKDMTRYLDFATIHRPVFAIFLRESLNRKCIRHLQQEQ
jgi:hypothetical protein